MPLGSLLGFAGAYCLKLHFYLKTEAEGCPYSVINPEDHNLEIVSVSFAFYLSPTHSFIHSLVFGPRGRFSRNQSPVMEPMWLLAHCILGKFLGIVCHCFSPPLDVRTFTTTRLCVLSDARDPSSERWNCGRERRPVVILPKFRLPRKFRDLLHAANLRHGTDDFTSPPKEGVLMIFSP